jgi:hypothetical protein
MKSRTFLHVTLMIALVLSSIASRGAPHSGEEAISSLMRGEPYIGPRLPAPLGRDGKPDLSGLWRPFKESGKPTGNLGKDEAGFQLPFSALGRRAVLYTQNHTVDPEALCILGGVPRHVGSGLPFEILHTPQRIAFAYTYNTSRRVSIDGTRKTPAVLIPKYFGTATAHWDDTTLVIETRGLRDSAHDRIWLDENGNPTSDQTAVVERWTRPDYHHLHVDLTVTDTKYYARAFSYGRTWIRADKGLGLQEYACNESNLDAPQIGPGAGVIGPDGNRGYGAVKPLPAVPPGPEAYAVH